MRQWKVLYRKELLEMWRSSKWLWVPVVSILLCVMTPVTSYYMPQLLKNAGNLPEGAILYIPVPKPGEVMVQTLSQFSTMGVLVLVLAFMGIVASERSNGLAAMMMVKPVRPLYVITAKWASMLTLSLLSFMAGYAAAWYYTELLIGHVPLWSGIAGMGVYSLWLVFILTVTILMSTWLKKSGAAAALTLLTAAVLAALTGMLPHEMAWSPGSLMGHAGTLVMAGELDSSFMWSLITTCLLMIIFLTATVYLFRRQER